MKIQQHNVISLSNSPRPAIWTIEFGINSKQLHKAGKLAIIRIINKHPSFMATDLQRLIESNICFHLGT